MLKLSQSAAVRVSMMASENRDQVFNCGSRHVCLAVGLLCISATPFSGLIVFLN